MFLACLIDLAFKNSVTSMSPQPAFWTDLLKSGWWCTCVCLWTYL